MERWVYWDGTTWLPARGPGEFETGWQRAALGPDVPSLLMIKVFWCTCYEKRRLRRLLVGPTAGVFASLYYEDRRLLTTTTTATGA